MKKIRLYIFPTLIALSALSISASAAYYSIIGLSKLFAGVAGAVVLMASSLEISKLVIASFLYQYWKNLNKLLKTYLTIALIILMFLTSAGIYGYLSSGYEATANKVELVENEVKSLEQKKKHYEDSKHELLVEKQQLNQSSLELRKALSINSTTQYKDKETKQILTISNSGNRKAFEKQLEAVSNSEDKLIHKLETVNDSIFKLENKIIETQSKNESVRELGPLKYISKLTGKPMDSIINWFLLVIIFVFDPLAISLVISANYAFNNIKKREIIPLDIKAITNNLVERVDRIEPPIIKHERPIEKDENEINIKNKIEEIKQQSISGWRKNKLVQKILGKGDEDNTITYT